MKLVDLDQTIFVPVVDESKGGVTYEMQMTVEQFFQRFFSEVPPIIDAIPVEWLEDMQRESLSENDRTMVGAIEAIFIEWHIYVNRLREMDRQKEQEAQDDRG